MRAFSGGHDVFGTIVHWVRFTRKPIDFVCCRESGMDEVATISVNHDDETSG